MTPTSSQQRADARAIMRCVNAHADTCPMCHSRLASLEMHKPDCRLIAALVQAYGTGTGNTSRLREERDAAIKPSGDLSEGVARALGLSRLGSAEGGWRCPDDVDLIKAVEAVAARAAGTATVPDELRQKLEHLTKLPLTVRADRTSGPDYSGVEDRAGTHWRFPTPAAHAVAGCINFVRSLANAGNDASETPK